MVQIGDVKMNGIRVLVLSMLLTQTAFGFQQEPERDFGWQIADDGVLEYILQISPQEAQTMLSQPEENVSSMPEELIGRASRVVVRIGTSILPRTPSLAVITRDIPRYQDARSAADLQASLGPGSFSDLESDKVRNIQGNGPQSLLPRGPAFPNAPLGQNDNLVDNAAATNPPAFPPYSSTNSQPQAGTNLGGQFLDESRGTLGRDNTGLGNTGLGNTGFGNMGASSLGANGSPAGSQPQSKYQDTASAAGMPANRSPATSPPQSGVPLPSQNWQAANNGIANDRFNSGSNAAPSTSGIDTRITPPALQGNWNGSDSGRGTGFPSTTGNQLPGRSLADRFPTSGQTQDPRMQQPGGGYQQPNTGYGGGTYGANGRPQGYGGGMTNGGLNGGYAGGNQRPADGYRLASNNQPTGGSSKENEPKTTAEDKAAGSPSDPAGSTNSLNRGKTGIASDNFVQVFFVLSLVVNFYLGMLIRKLLGRYRALLSSVRGQTA